MIMNLNLHAALQPWVARAAAGAGAGARWSARYGHCRASMPAPVPCLHVRVAGMHRAHGAATACAYACAPSSRPAPAFPLARRMRSSMPPVTPAPSSLAPWGFQDPPVHGAVRLAAAETQVPSAQGDAFAFKGTAITRIGPLTCAQFERGAGQAYLYVLQLFASEEGARKGAWLDADVASVRLMDFITRARRQYQASCVHPQVEILQSSVLAKIVAVWRESGTSDKPHGKLFGLWSKEELRHAFFNAMTYNSVIFRLEREEQSELLEPSRLVVQVRVQARERFDFVPHGSHEDKHGGGAGVDCPDGGDEGGVHDVQTRVGAESGVADGDGDGEGEHVHADLMNVTHLLEFEADEKCDDGLHWRLRNINNCVNARSGFKSAVNA